MAETWLSLCNIAAIGCVRFVIVAVIVAASPSLRHDNEGFIKFRRETTALKGTTKSKGPRTKMLLVYVGAGDSSDQPKIKFKDKN